MAEFVSDSTKSALPPQISDDWIAERWPDQDAAEVRRRFDALMDKLGETPWRGIPGFPETMQPVLAWAAMLPAERIEVLTAALAEVPDHLRDYLYVASKPAFGEQVVKYMNVAGDNGHGMGRQAIAITPYVKGYNIAPWIAAASPGNVGALLAELQRLRAAPPAMDREAVETDGYVLVPAVATREMVDAADACTDAYSAYAAMVQTGGRKPIFAADVLTEEWLADVLQDSLDMDWTSTDGARAIMRALDNGLVRLPQSGGQITTALQTVTPDLLILVKRLVVAGRTTGGTAGPDTGLMQALDDVERALSTLSADAIRQGEGECTLGVGCEQYGICYAKANGHPDQCEKLQATSEPAKGDLQKALEASLAKRSQPTMDPPYTAAFNAALDMVARDVAPYLATPASHASDGGEGNV